MSSNAGNSTELQRTLLISSRNRSSGTPENFVVTAPFQYFGPPNTPVRVKLVNATIPYTWFNITTSNNQFTLVVGASTRAITIPPGNYDAAGLLAALQTALNAAGLGVYTVTFSMTTYMYTITAASGNFSLTFPPTGSPAIALGFVPGTTVTSTGSAITAPKVTGINTTDLAVAVMTDLIQGSDVGVIPFGTTNTVGGILAVVPISGCYGNILQYCASNDLPFVPMLQSPWVAATLTGQGTLSIAFQLQLLSGLPLSLNGEEWMCVLVVDFASAGAP
jgi:hypothetical protein